MYKKLLTLFFIVVMLVLSTQKVFAHPIDNTDSYFYFEKETDNSALKENEIKLYSYINWFQAALLVESKLNITAADVLELLKYQDLYNEYAVNNIKVSNNGETCLIEVDDSPVTEDQISLSLGTRIIASFICPAKIENIKIENTLFINDFEFESNFTHLYNGENLMHAITLSRNNTTYEFNLESLKNNPKGDETIDNSANLTADQVTGNAPIEDNQQASANINEPKKRSFLTTLTDSLFLKTNTIKDQSVPFLLGLVFLLGFLHTIEAGHSKAILASSMIHKKMNVKKGLAYAVIFTVTHLGDIIIVGLILLLADNYFNILSNFSMIEKFAGFTLFFMSIYLLLKSLQHYVRKRVHVHDHDHTDGHSHAHLDHEPDPDLKFKDQLFLGFLAGLAPCVFGWSIFMLILSTKKLWILIPSMLFFGLGIFAALSVVVFIMANLKKAAYNKFEKIAEISPVVSALFLLVYSIFLIT